MKNNIARAVLFIIVLFLCILIYFSFKSFFTGTLRGNKPINIILIITSENKEAMQPELIFFLNYVPSLPRLNIIPIPKDIKILQKNNKSFDWGRFPVKSITDKSGIHIWSSEIKQSVENIFQAKASIPYYITLDRKILENMIDSAGGFTVEIDEYFSDKYNRLNMPSFLLPGSTFLNGREAIDYLAFEGTYKDFGETLRTRTFLKTFISKFSNPFYLIKFAPSFFSVLTNSISNLSRWDFFFGSIEFKNLKFSDIQIFQLPGNYRRGYFEPDLENLAGLADRLFPSKDSSVAEGPRTRIEVWNASGKNGLAEKVTWILREKGFDVVEFGNFSVKQKKTLIKDLSGESKTAQGIAELLACGEIVIRYEAKRYVDLSLILGEDCDIE